MEFDALCLEFGALCCAKLDEGGKVHLFEPGTIGLGTSPTLESEYREYIHIFALCVYFLEKKLDWPFVQAADQWHTRGQSVVDIVICPVISPSQ
jgi:hypothetical protein